MDDAERRARDAAKDCLHAFKRVFDVHMPQMDGLAIDHASRLIAHALREAHDAAIEEAESVLDSEFQDAEALEESAFRFNLINWLLNARERIRALKSKPSPDKSARDRGEEEEHEW